MSDKVESNLILFCPKASFHVLRGMSLCLPPQEVESAGEGEAKARVSTWNPAVDGSSDSSSGGGAWLANAARLLGVKEDALTRKAREGRLVANLPSLVKGRAN